MNFVKIMLDLQEELNNFQFNAGFALEYGLYPIMEMSTYNYDYYDVLPTCTVKAKGCLRVSFCHEDCLSNESFWIEADINEDNTIDYHGRRSRSVRYEAPNEIEKQFSVFIKAFWKHLQEKHKA